MTQYVEAKIENLERPMTAWILLSVAFLFVCAYAYFVNGTISNIVASNEMRSDIVELTSKIGNLESEFLLAKAGIDIAYVESMGFSKSKIDTIYISKKSVAALSFNK